MKSKVASFLFGIVILISQPSFGAEPFKPGDILVTDVFDENISPATEITEYTRAGAMVQTISVPAISNQPAEYARDPVVDQNGNLHIFNGTFYAGLSSFNPVTETWQNAPVAFNIFNGVSYGKLAAFNHFVFATDGFGITRIDTNDDSSKEFGSQGDKNNAPIDITLGYDGFLYSLDGTGSPSGRIIQVFNPNTLQLIRTITTPNSLTFGTSGDGPTSIVVDDSGFIYLNESSSGPIYKLTPDGQIVTSARYDTTSFVDDVDLSADGVFMMTQFDGRVTMLDSNLQEIATFTTAPGNHMSFGAFVNVPEPSTLTLLALGVVGLAVMWRRPRIP